MHGVNHIIHQKITYFTLIFMETTENMFWKMCINQTGKSMSGVSEFVFFYQIIRCNSCKIQKID